MSVGVKEGLKSWFSVEAGRFRLDVDAAYNVNTNSFGVGAVVRDYTGKLCATLAKPVARSSSVLGAELIAVLYGVGLCLQEGLVPVVLFSDSILAVRLLHELLDDSQATPELLSRDYPELVELVEDGFVLDFCHMFREANIVAHNLARYGASCSDMCIWTTDFPPWLTSLVNQDH